MTNFKSKLAVKKKDTKKRINFRLKMFAYEPMIINYAAMTNCNSVEFRPYLVKKDSESEST